MDEMNVNAQPQAEVTQEPTQSTEQVNDTTNTTQQTETQIEQPKVRVKYNKEEKELSLEEAAQYAQKGMNYDKVHEKATKLEQDYNLAREYGAEFGVYSVEDIPKLYGNQGINTLQEFKEAVQRKRMEDAGMNPDLVKSYIESDPDLQWARQERQKQQTIEQQWNDFLQLKEDFPEIKNPEDIPDEVIAIKNQRKCSYSDAMARYELNQTKAKLNEFTKGNKTLEANNNNASTSTGSVTGNGTATNDFFTREQVESMSTAEVMKHYDAVMKSKSKW